MLLGTSPWYITARFSISYCVSTSYYILVHYMVRHYINLHVTRQLILVNYFLLLSLSLNCCCSNVGGGIKCGMCKCKSKSVPIILHNWWLHDLPLFCWKAPTSLQLLLCFVRLPDLFYRRNAGLLGNLATRSSVSYFKLWIIFECIVWNKCNKWQHYMGWNTLYYWIYN